LANKGKKDKLEKLVTDASTHEGGNAATPTKGETRERRKQEQLLSTKKTPEQG